MLYNRFVMEEYNLKLKTQLQNLGFTDKEARVYIAILKIGKGTVSQISSSKNHQINTLTSEIEPPRRMFVGRSCIYGL